MYPGNHKIANTYKERNPIVETYGVFYYNGSKTSPLQATLLERPGCQRKTGKASDFMELRVLHYFLAVAREQSISGAAQSLHLSQPTLSTQLKGLEEELGKQLLIRGTKGSRKVTLTR